MTQKRFPSCLIGTVTFQGKDYVMDRFIKRVNEFTYPNKEFVIVDNSEDESYQNNFKNRGIKVIRGNHYDDTRRTIAESRNLLLKYMLEGDYDYLFHLESDVIPRKDIIEELIQWDKDIVGGWYYINQGKILKRPCIFKGWTPISHCGDKEKFGILLKEYDYDIMSKERLMKVYLGSFGISLIKRKVFEEKGIRFWWHKKFPWHDDTAFYHDCDIKGIEVYIDTDLLCSHFQSSWAVDDQMKKIEEQKKIEVINNG